MKKIFAILLSVALLISMTACSGLKKDDPTTAMEKLIDVLNGDYSNLESLAPQKFWDWAENNIENYSERWQETNEEQRSGALGQYGLNAEFSYEIHSTTILERTDERFQKMATFLNNMYSITEDELEEVCFMEGTNYINGNNGSNSYEHTYVAAKIDGQWYPMDLNNQIDFYIGFVGSLAS